MNENFKIGRRINDGSAAKRIELGWTRVKVDMQKWSRSKRQIIFTFKQIQDEIKAINNKRNFFSYGEQIDKLSLIVTYLIENKGDQEAEIIDT